MKGSLPMLRIGLMAIFAITVFALNYRELFRSKRVQQARGSIELMDVSQRVLVMRTDVASRSRTFVWDEKTSFFNIDGAITPHETTPGQRVWVTYSTHRGHELASRIEVEPVYASQT
jgi:hypothetical protein